MQLLVVSRDVTPLDFFLRASGKHIGSVILSRFLARYRRDLVVCLSIECFGASSKDKGFGGTMFEFCKKVLFHDVDNVIQTGVVVAQCVTTTRFWSHKMDESNVARALVFQLNSKYGTLFSIEDCCIMRCTFLDRNECGKMLFTCTDFECKGCKYFHINKWDKLKVHAAGEVANSSAAHAAKSRVRIPKHDAAFHKW